MTRALLCALVVGGALVSHGATAQQVVPRQYYTGWYQVQGKPFFFRFYYFKMSATDSDYKSHVVMFHPNKTREWVYFFDSDKKVYWARTATIENKNYGAAAKECKGRWDTLDEAKRKFDLKSISEEEFDNSQHFIPVIPGAKDGFPMDCPPIGLPRG